ncbi:MAG: sterol desaturase family protein [Lewinella sp.]|uniref:sterol desaturase family protein n=1 Tax=Lewinella sp. TaxID=2004506 RepID=UPI003D6A1821
MNNALFGVPNMDIYLVMGILIFFIVLEIIGGYWQKTQRTISDWIQEFGAFMVLSLLTKPGLVLVVVFLGSQFFPAQQAALAEFPLWGSLLIFLLVDDFLQYWYHRFAHEYEFLWKLHRPHHQAEEMGFFVSYRNAAIYYLFMPNIWWIGLFTFLGGAKAVALGLVLKQLIIISSHSTIAYDKVLYRNRFLQPLASVWERIFITPAFHHAHHGKSRRDGISDPNGNFGNMFSIWDQLFGTAHYSREFPTLYGLENDPKEPWTAAYLYPLVASDDPRSEISRGFTKKDTRKNEPAMIDLKEGERYLFCQCGRSQNQPFCDGSHHGTKSKPLLFTAQRSGPARLCNCKCTSAAPFCDDSHLKNS